MGKTILQIRDSIKEQVSGFYVTDDSRFDDEWLYDEIVSKNSSLLREEIKTGKTLTDRYYTFYKNITIAREEVSSTTVASITVSSGDYVYKSELPSLLDGVGWDNIKYLGTTGISANDSFTRKTLNGFMSSEGNKWTKGNPLYTLIGDIVYYKSLPTDGTRLVQGFLLLNNQRDGNDWVDSTSEFITPSITKLELLVIKQILSVLNVPADVLNDANSLIQQQTTKDGKE